MRGTSKKFQLLWVGALIFFFSSATIAQICVQPPAGLIAWWPGDGNANDIVGSNNGTLQGGANFAAGMVGQAFSFDGVDDSVNIPKAPNLDVGNQVTIDFWMKGDLTNPMDTCCQGLVTTDFYGIEIAGGGDPQVGLNFFVNTDPTGDPASFRHTSDLAGGGFPVAPGDWHHVAGVYDGSSIKLYVDAQLQAETPEVGNITPMRSTSFLAIGSEDGRTNEPIVIGTRYFKGLIDEVEVYNRPLTGQEIQAIFNAGSAGKCKGVSFKAFSADITIKSEPQSDQQTFKLNSKFIPGSESDGIDPANEAVSIQIGVFSITLPAGSFRSVGGNFSFDGVIAGVRLQVKIIQQNGRGWRLVAKGGHANLSGTQIPVKVGLIIGDDNGSVTLKNTLLMAGSDPIKMDTDDKAELP